MVAEDAPPERWRTGKFGDLAVLVYGKSLSAARRNGGVVPVCGSNGVVGYHDEPLVAGPGIVIGRKGTAGSAMWVESDFWPIDTTYYVERRTKETDVRWLYYAISRLHLENLSEGPVPGLNRHAVAELPLTVPPPPEQRRIAEILSAVDDAIEKAHALVDQVHVLKRGLMAELLTPPGKAGSWASVTLGDVATVVGGGTPSRQRSDYWDGDVPWATPTDVTALRGRVISTTASTITRAGLANSSATLLPSNSLLVTTRATIGACAVNRVSMATNQGFQSLVVKEGACVDYLYYLIQHRTRDLERLGAGSTYLEIPKRTFSKLQISLPPVDQQRRIAAVLCSVDETIRVGLETADSYTATKRDLMSVLLNGEIRAAPVAEVP